ncbi:hypothetical protein CU044_2265 [Streptomyces sp. L-9-10]|nr:hypothetical protein CU044_2265 [Streptomyces sp. L-9-10]
MSGGPSRTSEGPPDSEQRTAGGHADPADEADDADERTESVAVLSGGETARLAPGRVAILAVAGPVHLPPLLLGGASVRSRTARPAEVGVSPPAAGVRVLPCRIGRQIARAVAVIVDRPGVVLREAHPQGLGPVRTGHLVPSGTAAPSRAFRAGGRVRRLTATHPLSLSAAPAGPGADGGSQHSPCEGKAFQDIGEPRPRTRRPLVPTTAAPGGRDQPGPPGPGRSGPPRHRARFRIRSSWPMMTCRAAPFGAAPAVPGRGSSWTKPR